MVRRAGWRRPAMAGSVGVLLGTALVVLTGVAFACTSIMAQMTINPTSGAFGVGTVVNTSVTSGMKPGPAVYAIHLTKGLTTAGADCMSFSGVITLKKVTPDASGGWNVNVKIPATTTRGTHGICGMELSPAKGVTGTTHDTFTVM